MPARHPPLRVVAADRDITERHRGLTFSNVDPGGLELLSCQPGTVTDLRAGDRVRVDVGCEVAWAGDINDPGDQTTELGSGVITAVGPGRVLKQNAIRRLYVHNKLSDWMDGRSNLDASLASLLAAWQIDTDGGIKISYPANTAANGSGLIFLDAGAGNTIARIAFTYASSAWAANNALYLLGGDTFASLGADNTSLGALSATASTTGSWTLPTPRRFVAFRIDSNGHTPASDEWWKLLTVSAFGSSAYESSGASILTPQLVTLDALSRATPAGIVAGEIGVSAITLPHLIYDQPTLPEQIIDDESKITGWHWGVWEPATIFDSQPRLFFRPPPAAATASVRWSDCPSGDAPRARLDLLYDSCRCQYTTVDGQTAYQTVTRPNPLLPGVSRTLEVNMGQGSAATANLYAAYALALSQRASRGGGWAQLPAFVQTPTGPKPSCLLKAGLDRLQVVGLTDPGSLLDDDGRTDTFHLRRVEVTVDDRGAPRTRVEFDGGGDLMEVLNAQLTNSAQRLASTVGLL